VTKSKPFRTRLKIALAVTVLFAVMGWLVVFPVYQRHRAIVEIILRVDGSIDRETSGPQWLRQWGIKFDHVDKVNLAGTNITDNGLRHFNGLTNLTALYLSQTNITDDGLKHLSRLKNLERLSLMGTQISDEGLKHLSPGFPIWVEPGTDPDSQPSRLYQHHLPEQNACGLFDIFPVFQPERSENGANRSVFSGQRLFCADPLHEEPRFPLC